MVNKLSVDGEYQEEIRDIEDIIERIEEFLEEHRVDDVRRIIDEIEPQDLLDILARLDTEKRRKLLSLIPSSYFVQILSRLPDDVLYELILLKGASKLARILSDMHPDEIADVLMRLPSKIRNQILSLLPPWKITEVSELMKYPQESAGGVMTTRVPIFHKDETVGTVLEKYSIKYQLGLYDKLNYVYVVDDEGKLVGWVDIRTLMTKPRDKKIGEIAQEPPATVNVLTDREEAARLVVKYDLTEIPVVDDEGRLVGVITVDDIIDVIVAESTEDLLKFGGLLEAVKGSYLTARAIELARRRATWLIVLYMLESITVSVISRFESVLASVIALSFFIPLLTDTGGNTGSQSATLVIRSLATGEARISDFFRIIVKELSASSILAMIMAPIGFGIAYAISLNLMVALTVALALSVIIVVASMLGVLLPFIAVMFKLDPALISAPLITTVADITGITLYFTIAIYLMGL
ncbi:magnesium transporter [Desulfurococcaceae archaeon MEX13E-LK6-19]|nr:magnesium transporter [Desulfurococcaceae archaeon MEX13E-LK6-19]